MKRLAVIIPLNRVDWNWVGEISLKQAISQLSGYDIYIIKPESFAFEQNIGKNLNVQIINFDEKYFGSQEAHNQLLLSRDLYSYFHMYEYILIYHMDAFLFENRLDYFMDLGYDYYGAPWNLPLMFYNERIVSVGNGGFSLRKTSTFLDRCDELKKWHEVTELNEDVCISLLGIEGKIQVAPTEVARQFSVEDGVMMTYVPNGNRLPMACHAWNKFNTVFLRPFIEKYGHKLPKNNVNMGILDLEFVKYIDIEKAYYYRETVFSGINSVVILGALDLKQLFLIQILIYLNITCPKIIYDRFIGDYRYGAEIVSLDQTDFLEFKQTDRLLIIHQDLNDEITDKIKFARLEKGKDYILTKEIEDIFRNVKE